MPLQQETSPAVATPPDGVCHFDRLPPELLAVVCSLAYGRPTAKRLLSKPEYDSVYEELVKAGNLASAPPFVHHVNKFLVSKRFLLSAVEAFIKVQHFDLTTRIAYKTMYDMTDQIAFRLFARFFKLPSYHASRLAFCASLTNVCIMVEDISFEYTTSTIKKYPWLHVFQDSDFEEIEFVKELSTLRGLKTLTCEASLSLYADTTTKEQMWRDNISALQDYLMPIVTARRSAFATTISSRSAQPESLYPGSSVSGIGCKPTLLANRSKPIDLIPSMITEVLGLKPDKLHRWIERALRDNPLLGRPI